MRTALVFSGGGMFGAYQAGAWRRLAVQIRPDLVVGASVGSLNGWCVAGACEPGFLIDRWLDRRSADLIGRPLDSSALQREARSLCARLEPRIDFGVVVVEFPRFRSKLICTPAVTWRHLAASCAVPPWFAPVRIDGRWYVDGGLLRVLPLWAAAEMGATQIVAVNALPRMPSALVRGAARGLRALARERRPDPSGIPILLIAPRQPLGTLKDMLVWRRENIQRWIEHGERDAEEVLRRTPLLTV